ncbi:MAG: SpoIIE family protein phosphatase [Eubacteriales bacterium]|nr:SpoIIE family protein phosphatase [Eubacteriales bacterium]
MKKDKKAVSARIRGFITAALLVSVLCSAACRAEAGVPAGTGQEAEAGAPAGTGEEGGVRALNASGGLNGAASVDPVGQKEGFSAVLYDSTNGLPTSEANAIAETEEGFIWIGSYSGLIRFDGENFERMDSSTGIASVKCLYVDRDNRLWIGTNDSGIFVMEKGVFRNWSEQDGLKSTAARSIIQDTDGTVYVGMTYGIAAIDREMNLRVLEDPEISEEYIQELRPGGDGIIYGLTNSGKVFTLENGKVGRCIRFEESRVRNSKEISCILPDPAAPGNIYLATGDSRVFYCSCGEYFKELKTIDISPLSQVQQFEYIDGRIWICTRRGIGVIDADGFHKLDNVPMDNSIGHVMTDYEGNLWFTSTRQGVMKIVPNRFSDIFERYDLPGAVVNSTCRSEGRLFIAADTGLTVLDERGVVDSIPLTGAKTAGGIDLETSDLLEMLDGVRIRSIIRDSRGRLWISTWRRYGLLLYDKGEVTAFTVEDGLFSDQVRTVYERRDGSILAACTGGVNVIVDGRVTAGYSEKDGIINTEILTVAEGTDGDILVGTDGGGIYFLGRDGVRRIGRLQGLTSDAVMRIKPDPEKNLYWVVTGTSIAVLTADYRLMTLNQFPYSNNFDLYWNREGEVWILSSNGVYVSRKDDLLANEKTNPLHYSRADGLPCIATANSYSELTEDGDLYIAGTSGVARVNIENPFENVNRLKVAVPYVEGDDVRIYPDADGGFTVPQRIRKLTVYSYVYNYSLLNPQVSYCLEGFDQKKTTVKRSDLDPVVYTNLPGGTYHFLLQLKDSMGRGDRTVSIRVTKERAIYEHAWFIILAVLLFILLLVKFVSLYFSRKIDAMEKRHREEAEKQRISSELNMASRLQESMLPQDFPPFPDRSEFDIYASMNPAREVGGDFYDFFMVDDDHLCIVIADVSGKGIPAALFMMVSKVILQNCAMLGQNAAEILTKTNEALCSNNRMEMFVTVWVGILEISTGIIRAANAGHEYPAVMKDGRFALLRDKHGLVVGAMEAAVYKAYEIRLDPGDKLFVYTDGVTEATDAENRLFGTDRLIVALNNDPGAAPQTVLKNVRKAVDGFVKDAEQFDDLTMLCLEYKGNRCASRGE